MKRKVNADLQSARNNRSDFEYLFQNVSTGVSLLDKEGKPVKANDAFLHLVGYDSEEIKQLSIMNLVHPEDKEWCRKEHEQLLDGSLGVLRQKKRYVHKNGETVWANVLMKSMTEDGDQGDFFLAIFDQDLEVNKEQQYKDLFVKHGRDQFSVIDQKGLYVWVNPSTEAFSGYHSDELIGKPWLNFIHPDDQQAVLGPIFDSLLKGECQKDCRLEFRFRSKDGNYHWIETLFKPILGKNDEVQGALASNRDISTRKLAELENIRLTEELRARNREMREYAFSISHRFRVPVVNMIGLLNLFERNETAFNEEVLELMKEEAKKLDAMLHEISERIAR